MLALLAPWSRLTYWDGLIILSVLILLTGIGLWWSRRGWLKRLTEAGGIDLVQLEELRYGESPLVVDLRPSTVHRGPKGHIKGSLNVPFEELVRRIKELDTHDKRPVVLADEDDRRLLDAAAILKAHGITWIYLLKGGLRAWRRQGHPLEYFSPSGRK